MSAAMSARLRDYRMLWRAAVTHANPRLSRILSWGVAFLVIVIGAGVTAKRGPRAGLTWFWCTSSALLLMHWAWRFVPGAVKLNAPAYAKLVPQMRRRLVELSVLVCCLGVAGIASAPYADSGRLGAWLFWIVTLIVLLGLAHAGHRAASTLILIASFSWILIDQLPASLVALVSHPLAVVLALPLYAGVILTAARAMFPEAGERHWAMLALRARWASAAGKPDPLVEQLAGAQTKGAYARDLRRASVRRDGRSLVLHALGPARHIGESLVVLGILTLVLVGIGIAATLRIDPEVVPGLGWLFACILLFVPVAHAVRLGTFSGQHVAEQALVRLAPASPAGARAFNAGLGHSLLRQALKLWGTTTAAALLLVTLSGARAAVLLDMAALCCLVLPVMTVPLRDHSSRNQHVVVGALLLFLASVAGSALAGIAAKALLALPALAVTGLASIGFTVFLALRGLRTMEAAPFAFPAARMD